MSDRLPATAPEENRRRYGYDEVLRLTTRRRIRELEREGPPIEILCHDTRLIHYRDVVDFALGLSGHSGWSWLDRRGCREPGAGLGRSVSRMAREVLLDASRVYLKHRRAVSALERSVQRRTMSVSSGGMLYVRSDHVFGTEAGGSVAHVAGVIGGLRQHGIEVEVVSSDLLPGVPNDERFHLETPLYEPIRNLPELPRLEYNPQLLESIERRWEQWSPRAIYHRYSHLSYIGPALRQRHGVPYICEYNGSFVWMNRNWGRRPLYLEGLSERVEMLNLQAADLVVVGSDAAADELTDRGIPRDKVLVNPNGVDPLTYRPDLPGEGVRRNHGLEDALVVGFIGSFGPWHGAEKLVEAASRLEAVARPADVERIRFLMIGDGERMPAVRRLIERHGLHDRVILVGRVPQEEGPAYLAACDILASPHVPNPDGSRFFGSPTKLFEYMAMGRAIVASDLEQIGEVLQDGKTALLVRPGDADALARAILTLAQDESLQIRLGRNARSLAERHHSWEQHTRRILEALDERVRPASRPASDPSLT